MSGRKSRQKGVRGELEWCKELQKHGFEASRNRIGASGDDVLHNVPGVSFEVKRGAVLQIPAWVRQAEEQAGSRVPCLAFRRNSEPWRVVVPADHYLALLAASDPSERVVPDPQTQGVPR